MFPAGKLVHYTFMLAGSSEHTVEHVSASYGYFKGVEVEVEVGGVMRTEDSFNDGVQVRQRVLERDSLPTLNLLFCCR